MGKMDGARKAKARWGCWGVGSCCYSTLHSMISMYVCSTMSDAIHYEPTMLYTHRQNKPLAWKLFLLYFLVCSSAVEVLVCLHHMDIKSFGPFWCQAVTNEAQNSVVA